MTPAELKTAREKLGLTQRGLARVIKVKSDRTIRKWEDGESDIAGPAVVLIRLLLEMPAARRVLGI